MRARRKRSVEWTSARRRAFPVRKEGREREVEREREVVEVELRKEN